MNAAILIVDDNQSNLDTLRYLIEDIEFDRDIKIEVIEAKGGNEALALALKHNLALIILDIQMPVMDGFEVAKYLKKSSKTKDIPIAFLTAAYKSQEMREYGLHLGAFDYFLKPIDPLILVPKIKLYVNFYTITNELKDTNISLEKKVSEAIEKNKKMEQKLFQSEKLSSMGEMIGNIAHQWRQPLSVISTAATGVKAQKEYGMLSDEFLIESLDTINDTAQYLSKTIDDFKNFIKGDENSKKEFNLLEDIKRCLEIESSIIKQNDIKVILDIPEDISLWGFPNALVQCLVNLINNSKDVLVQQEERYIFIEAKTDENNVAIRLRDNGGGIKEEIMDKIFDPYFTTKNKAQGTGLGLYMTYTIITSALSGSIAVENREYKYEGKDYKGAEFIITLPLKLGLS
jgi:signal transduction histidine kinase